MTESPLTFLPWDSAFFEQRIFRVESALHGESGEELLRECLAESVECLYLLVDSGDAATIGFAQDHGFRFVDLRLTFAWEAGEQCAATEALSIRPAEETDIPELARIAASVHGETRFFVDHRFAAKAPELYRVWITKSVRGWADVVLVAELSSRPVGYVTGHRDPDGSGHIGLVGVDPDARGRGLGRALIEESQRWFAAEGMRRVHVSTQGSSITAQRLYQRCGFVTSNVKLWFHRWFDELP